MTCCRTAGRRPCATLLTISSDIDPIDVLWFGPRCEDHGLISGWEGTFWDNGTPETDPLS
ncbi:MAG: hypothetical protein ACP5P4_09980 [Steroidobacteraceae bacterium]